MENIIAVIIGIVVGIPCGIAWFRYQRRLYLINQKIEKERNA